MNETLNDRPVWKNNDETMYISSWVMDDGFRYWRLGRTFNSSSAYMRSRETSNGDCPYQTDGSRFVKDFFTLSINKRYRKKFQTF